MTTDQFNRYQIRLKRHIDKMPALPVTVAKVLEVCNNPSTSPVDLNKVISVDPVLMGRVLKLINSAYYGLSSKITSLVRAIIMLGINTVKNLALSTAVLNNLGAEEAFEALDAQGFWRHCLGVGVTAKLLAKRRRIRTASLDEYFIAGLLHDIGKIPMNNALSDEYMLVLSHAERERIPLYKAEREILGMDHSQAGVLIGKQWRLGDEVIAVIESHHDPESYTGEYRDLVNTIAVANYFVNLSEIGFAGDRFPERSDLSVFTDLGIDLEYLDQIADDVRAEIERAAVFLRIAERAAE